MIEFKYKSAEIINNFHYPSHTTVYIENNDKVGLTYVCLGLDILECSKILKVISHFENSEFMNNLFKDVYSNTINNTLNDNLELKIQNSSFRLESITYPLNFERGKLQE